MEKSLPTSSGKPPPAKTSTGKSNIQSKIAARKKRERRSMTQPITGDDVTAAKELVKNSKDPADVGSDEEEELSFADRLTYFNQLCAKPSPAKTQQKLRTSFKRFNTQPVNRDDIVEAKKLYNNKSSVKDSSEISTSLSDLSQTATKIPENLISKDPLNKSSNSVSIVDLINPEIEPVPSFEEDLCNTASEDSSKIDETKSRGRETTKVGKLADDLKLKFAKNKEKPSVESPTRKPHSPSRATDSSAVAKQQLRKRSPSPLVVRKLSSASSSAGSSSDSGDMGKEMEREIKSTGSIHDRLKLLQKNQEEDWKRRVKKDNRSGVKSSLGERKNRLQDNEDKWKDGKGDSTPNVPRGSTVSKSNISDRLNSILANSEKWKAKSGKQNDATQFTVQAKAHKREGSTGVPMTSSPSLKRKVLPVPIGNQPVVTIDDVTNDVSSLSKLSEVLKLSQKGLEEDVIKTLDEATQEIPMMTDSDFDNFFSSNTDVILSNGQDLNGTDEMMDFSDQWLELEDSLKLMRNKPLSDLGRLKSNVKRHSSRNKRSTRNPVKALAAREDIKQSYTEQRSNVSKLEQQRLASRGGNFTSAALAGLAHKADFSKVNLKSTTQPAFTANDLQPWSDKMLLRVKGRRHVQTRLVEPCCASLNSGDAYLLITPTQLFAWFGEFANVIEKAKVQEIADYIIHKGDMGSKATSLTIIEETQSTHLKSKPFFTLIGGEGKIEPYGGDKEDEIYEVNSEAAIKSYKLKDEKLVPHSEAWGKLPSMRMLDTKDTYVFDFGGEMYIWQGKEVSFSDRQLAVRLARTLWDQGYDYSDIGFCPFGPISSASINLKGPRPEWGLFARVNENLETALIQEKFEDWSNISREVGDREEVLKESSRGQLAVEMQTKVSIKPEMVACDIKQMTSEKLHPLPLHLEGHNVWRGHGHIYDDDGRGLLVVTSAVDTWYATEKNMIKVEKPLHGVFHRSETYVVRWKYVVSSTGKWLASKSQPGVDLKAAANGRERTSYFLWAGRDSSVNEKGASALMATEIDKDGGAQITVHEGREPPAFVQCFNGGMTVVDGKIGKREGFYSWKLFCIRGSIEEETALYQMPCEFQSLRSRSSFILFNGRLAKIVVWHGVCSSKSTRELIMEAANKMKETKAECLGFRSSCKNAELSVCEEGKENADFSEGMGRVRRTKYVSLLDTPDLTPSVPRAWHLLPSGDHFVAHELPPVLEYPSDENDKSEDVEIFPIIQEQLTELSKPALVLVNGTEGVFLWQSVGGEDMKGSGKRQFDISRRLAMETTINYCKEHRPDCTPMLINEKHEPMEFTNSFPVWLESKQKFSFEERRAKKPKPVAEVLGSLSRLTYSLEELRAPSLPEGVDPNHLETYLSTEDFEKLFQITKEEFYAMPPWKQHNLRKEKDLF